MNYCRCLVLLLFATDRMNPQSWIPQSACWPIRALHWPHQLLPSATQPPLPSLWRRCRSGSEGWAARPARRGRKRRTPRGTRTRSSSRSRCDFQLSSRHSTCTRSFAAYGPKTLTKIFLDFGPKMSTRETLNFSTKIIFQISWTQREQNVRVFNDYAEKCPHCQ